MDIFNRVVVILVLVLLVAALVWALLQPLFFVEVLQQAGEGLKEIVYSNYLLYLAVAAVLLLIAVVFLWLELRRRTRKTVRVHQVSSGEVDLSVASIGQSLEYFVNGLEGVIRVKPKIVSKGKAVDVILNVETRPDVDVPSKTNEICDVARDVVEGRLGLQLHKIRASIKHAPYPRGTKPQESAPAALAAFAIPEPEPYVPHIETAPVDVLAAAASDEPAGGSEECVLPPFEGQDDLS